MKAAIICAISLGFALNFSGFSAESPTAKRATGQSGEQDVDRHALLAAVRTWMYQIDKLEARGAVDALAASSYPMLVLESGINDKDSDDEFARQLIGRLRTLPDGRRRLLIAYIDIGQAEDYRAYWKKDWQAPDGRGPGKPSFLLAPDPDGWNGSCQVAYWDKAWQKIWLAEDGVVPRLARLGFDGIYLDWIDAYGDPKVVAAAKRAGLDPALEMIEFVGRLGDAGRRISPGFLVIAQNAVELIDSAADRYTQKIDAVSFEDTWFYGKGGAKWNSPKAGDLRHQDEDADWTPQKRITLYRKYLARGLPVFTVDYCVNEANAAFVYSQAIAADFRPLVTRVSLSQMTVTPPEKYHLISIGDNK